MAAATTAELTATDLDDAMVKVGREREPNGRWQQADATTLPFDDRSFDVVACQFGVMIFPEDLPTFIASLQCR